MAVSDGICITRLDGRTFRVDWSIADSLLSVIHSICGVIVPIDGPIGEADASKVAEALIQAADGGLIGLRSTCVDNLGACHGHQWDIFAMGREIERPLSMGYIRLLSDLVSFLADDIAGI